MFSLEFGTLIASMVDLKTILAWKRIGAVN